VLVYTKLEIDFITDKLSGRLELEFGDIDCGLDGDIPTVPTCHTFSYKLDE